MKRFCICFLALFPFICRKKPTQRVFTHDQQKLKASHGKCDTIKSMYFPQTGEDYKLVFFSIELRFSAIVASMFCVIKAGSV